MLRYHPSQELRLDKEAREDRVQRDKVQHTYLTFAEASPKSTSNQIILLQISGVILGGPIKGKVLLARNKEKGKG